ncbi:hypothetical protein EIP86_004561 [Pleurotus ostreatoroseus]|nr:hypothetical protein EIP86_004561 [Pleurotus ostreatoroseus]
MTSIPTDDTHSGTNNKRSSKKMANAQSLNHLLNFSLPPRQNHQYQSLPRRRKPGVHQPVLSKEREYEIIRFSILYSSNLRSGFINAQYRFVMNPSGDYTVIIPRTSALASASRPSEHTSQEEGVTTCPICLSPPTAPRMTKCGHDSINEKQLKAVKWIDNTLNIEDEDDIAPTASSSSTAAENPMVSSPAPGTVLRMRLMQRPQITTLALPRSRTWPSDLLPPHQAPFHFLPDVHAFAKFMLATPSTLITDLTADLDDLATERRTLAGMQDDLGVAFVDAAEQKVRHQIAKAAALETPQLKDAVEAAHHTLEQIEGRAALHERKAREEQTRSATPLTDVPSEFLAYQASGFTTPSNRAATPAAAAPESPSAAPARGPKQRRNVNPPPSASSYYYYQAASGMPVFLHPLEIKMLLSHFGSYSAFPDTIAVRVESCAESTVDEALRKRCKYLAHLPLAADVVFVEADLEGVVGADGLKNFERALAMRKARREQKEKKDDKARVKAEEREKERLVDEWNRLTRHRVDAYIPPPAPRVPSPSPGVDVGDLHDFPEPGRLPPPPAAARTPEATGVWGSRSFATAAQQHAASRSAPAQRPARRVVNEEDEYDLDVAFHELEQRAGRGGGKRRNNRLVVLGGGGGRRR